MITNFFASDWLLIPHDFWISDERQMTIRPDVEDQLSQRNNASPEDQYKSDALPIQLTGHTVHLICDLVTLLMLQV